MRQRKSFSQSGSSSGQGGGGNQRSGSSRRGNRYRGPRPDSAPRSRPEASNVAEAFPSPSLLQEYEYASEGAAARILELAAREQEFRHKQEYTQAAFIRKTRRIAQLTGFLILFSAVWISFSLAQLGMEPLAIVISGGAFLSATIASLFGMASSRPGVRGQRPPQRDFRDQRPQRSGGQPQPQQPPRNPSAQGDGKR